MFYVKKEAHVADALWAFELLDRGKVRSILFVSDPRKGNYYMLLTDQLAANLSDSIEGWQCALGNIRTLLNGYYFP